jgi:hypothetical protein
MNKLFAALATSVALCAPLAAMADPANIPIKSMASLGCMKLGECTDDVTRITSVEQLKAHYGPEWIGSHEQELTALIDRLNAAKIEVYLATELNFPTGHRGIYYTDVNKMFMNQLYGTNVESFLSTLRHEGWHAVQDCMAGTIGNSFIAVVHNEDLIPQEHKMMADVRYRFFQPGAIPWEQEAIWAGDTENMTADALNACASGEMWKEYEPTPMTREWLETNSYL